MSRQRDGRGPPLDLSGLDAVEGPPARGGPTMVDWAAFLVAATRRRARLFAAVLVVGLVASAAYYKLKTPVYRVEARILAQRQQALPGVVRAPGGEDAPQRSAWDLVHSRDNLVALVEQAGLLARGGPESGADATRVELRPRMA